jgi:TonB family protein
MKKPVLVVSAGVLTALMAAAPAVIAAQDSVTAARDLYSGASYDEALAMLDRMRPSAASAPGGYAIEQYRAFCLVALGRTAEAEQAIEALVAIDPTFVLPASQAPPRIVAMFASVRQRALPGVLRARFESAKALHAEKRHAEAVTAFSELKALLDNPEVIGVAGQDMAGLRTVVAGFLDLSRAAHDAASRAVMQQVVQAASVPARQPAPPPAPAPRREGTFRAAPSGTPPGYGNGIPSSVSRTSGSVVPPGIISQQLPRATGLSLPAGSSAIVVVDVVIDELGRVERATVRQSANAFYESQLLAAAKSWRYTPAMQAGKPVRYVKTLEITLTTR